MVVDAYGWLQALSRSDPLLLQAAGDDGLPVNHPDRSEPDTPAATRVLCVTRSCLLRYARGKTIWPSGIGCTGQGQLRGRTRRQTCRGGRAGRQRTTRAASATGRTCPSTGQAQRRWPSPGRPRQAARSSPAPAAPSPQLPTNPPNRATTQRHAHVSSLDTAVGRTAPSQSHNRRVPCDSCSH